MPRDPEQIQLRDAQLRKEFKRMRELRNEHGELVHHAEYCLGTVARKFWLSKRRAEDIIYNKSAASL